MYLSNFDTETLSGRTLKAGLRKLKAYRAKVKKIVDENDCSQPEYALAHIKNQSLHDQLEAIKKQFKGIKQMVLVGIGGSNLGTEAIHQVLDTGQVKLHTLDTVSAHELDKLLKELKLVKSVKKLAVCVISKSGGTTETLVNAGVLLEALEKKFNKNIYKQTIFIGNAGTDFMKTGKRLGVTTIAMPEVIGGRYSVATEVGLVPLAILGYDTDALIEGLLDATNEEFETVVAENAVRLHFYLNKNFKHYNFFAFEPRLYLLGAWYRQLFAESLGKSHNRAKKPVKKGWLPTISTPTELHSVGQLYLSGFAGVFTDFVTFDDDSVDYDIPKKGLSKLYSKYQVQEVATALYGGVMGAYQEKKLPYRSVIFDENLTYSLGLFIGMRMLETMYVAELMNINAFDQPNVELYKTKTKKILNL
ncbi:hypothetical protein KC851_03770 [Candidatus Kaiserbacteria bacterium]|nr:hypothetical protein [Candidatus Kaiserbacteria bacterium]